VHQQHRRPVTNHPMRNRHPWSLTPPPTRGKPFNQGLSASNAKACLGAVADPH
jgi:hypothetical protein